MSSRTRLMLADKARLALCELRFSRRLSLVSSCGSVFSRVDTAGSRGRDAGSLASPRPRPSSLQPGARCPGAHLTGPRRVWHGPGPGSAGLRTGPATAPGVSACPESATARGRPCPGPRQPRLWHEQSSCLSHLWQAAYRKVQRGTVKEHPGSALTGAGNRGAHPPRISREPQAGQTACACPVLHWTASPAPAS